MQMRKTFIRTGSLLAGLGVAIGAFSAHLLKEHITTAQMETFQTGVRYHLIHALGFLMIGVMLYFRRTKWLLRAGWSFVIGIVLFSGSLYLLSVRDLLSAPIEWIGFLTPLGGLFFIAGWIGIFLSTYESNELYKHKSRAESTGE